MKSIVMPARRSGPKLPSYKPELYYGDDFDPVREDAVFYRDQTIAVLRNFYEAASQIGRVASILGRELFRAKVSFRGIPSFEDQAVYVHDVERCLAQLSDEDADIVALVGLFQQSCTDVGRMLGCTRARVVGRYAVAIDLLATMFLEAGILRESRLDRRLRYFPVKAGRPALPPRKPVQSVAVEEYHADGEMKAGRCLGGDPQTA